MSSGGLALPGSGGQGPGEKWEEVHDEVNTHTCSLKVRLQTVV